ncbi:hypothetical protein BO94DRAFT_615945 [Aspergillus sclerotioniger CBS 115572]|uniref:Heterokaryon incompatibility domain-containing protein n=1 Tax=Aspergillus sclerotioniger CBS 115572 TaxID=1450535 RepID=A0A317X6B9_9EURO|nr:hypothetical protein BO94DRAFT_615945 [Aspergillus sclerotioniger CBS 115572]PWY93107.1 hypothetical protein BO94DRAFT_615945 [Aspergillus sclerotioniger CBS 115572]
MSCTIWMRPCQELDRQTHYLSCGRSGHIGGFELIIPNPPEELSNALKPYSVRTGEGDVAITASLYDALTRTQQAEGSIDIWADSISISQADATEKSHEATQVFGWVGDEAKESSLAMNALRSITVSPSAVSRLEKNIWGAIIKLFARPWFVRSWVIQDVILARELHVVCGSEKLSWEKLYDAVHICETCIENNEKYELLDLFELFQHAKSTLRRDRLFTLLNIAADAEGFSTDFIVFEYASKFAVRGKGLELLSRARGLSSSRRFPSWIPDWTANRYPTTISGWPSEQKYRATGDSEASISVDPDNKAILLAGGLIVDTVVRVGSCLSQVDKAMDDITDILKRLDLSQPGYPTEGSRGVLKFRIPIGEAWRGVQG